MTCLARELATAPSLLTVHRRYPDRWSFLLASSASAGKLGRWSLLLRAADEKPLVLDPSELEAGSGFLDELADRQGRASVGQGDSRFPFCGGWFVYLGYELAGEVEPGLKLPPATDGLPVALAQRCRSAVLQDHLDDRCWVVAEDEAELAAALEEVASAGEGAVGPLAPLPDLALSADPGERFKSGVERIREYIRAGDVFQVNLSRGWEAVGRAPIDPAAIYRALAGANPAPFAALARLPGGTVVSSSPERLVSVDGRVVQTRPIAGTRPRGLSEEADSRLTSELVSHPKERAEHIMLIDLERNDLGRVCRVGSVEVDELMVVESYAHVHHIVSNVRGQLRDGASAADVIRAVFPGGTITGCPKVRCMEIIAELEGQGRGCYTGALGYLGLDGRMDLNILIRSMVVGGERISFRTGAGIVADSDPAAELAETEDKARGLLNAIGHG
ncbi:aminodeoxychorismate synthase component I [Wenzhouxiangella sediminis]|uniref:Aminodeoxychorismate synthase component I n=1 Tax=Wenzhouxiangella sediminis TaxID=1792836 RepID=A0A3E1KC63_9GAMM|nr:aminodeoxychorismate synthase component I [Wenzhouxiangella sediminis]RFF32197.1 aminodeoxychorismate synthase component I [Wenzhouxiangella sediminis]